MQHLPQYDMEQSVQDARHIGTGKYLPRYITGLSTTELCLLVVDAGN